MNTLGKISGGRETKTKSLRVSERGEERRIKQRVKREFRRN